MSMTPEHIREFSLLELLAIGELSLPEQLRVEAAMESYPELKKEFQEIERSLQIYAEANAIMPPNDLLSDILGEVKNDPTTTINEKQPIKPEPNLFTNALFAVLGLSLLLLILGLFQAKSSNVEISDKLEKEKQKCDSLQLESNRQLQQYQSLIAIENTRVKITPTEKYPNTDIIINLNTVEKKNFIQVNQLPPIADNQSFQLWSLTPNLDPAPLNVFDETNGNIFEALYVEGTASYAITIEKKEGSSSPTLENLIGVFTIKG